MAVTQNTYTGDGSTVLFSFTFPYLETTDIKVSVNGTVTTAYTLANATTIQFNTAPANGAAIRIYRQTDDSALAAQFYPGSAIRSQDLNDNFTQNLYVTQEVNEYSWDNETDTIKSPQAWVSSDSKIATTASIDQRVDSKIDTAITNDIAGSDGISITDDGDGTITVGIAANSVDLDRLKNEDIITYAEQEAGSPSWLTDTRIPTTYAAARRFDTLVQTTTPAGSNWAIGKTWLQNDQDLTVSVWNGSAWLAVASGGSFTNQPKVVYVDATAGDDNNNGHRISRPKKTIKAAVQQINADATYGDGSVVVVAPGIYQEVAPIDITKKDVSIIGTALRSCIVHPTPATETNSLFRVNSGTFLQNLTFTGVKASGVRGGAGSVDPDGTYGLPVTQGWNVSFYPGAMIYKSPYIQNCTNFSDSEINNANLNAHTPAGGSAGDTDSAVTGGGLLVDGAVVNSNSPLRSMVCDAYTHVGLDGPGILVTNNGYCQATSSYAFFNHYHIKCLNGGQANLSASTTDFGRYGLIADGRSTSAIFTASTTANAADQDITFTINAPVAGASWHGSANRPQGNMLVDIGGNTYPILSSVANGTGWDVTISRPNPLDKSQNLGLDGAVPSGSPVSFYLRSMIASSGHTMEYCGSGTNYSALPENGGVPVDASQIVELNNGKVWAAITDHNGKFKLGDFFIVDQQASSVSVSSGSFALDLSTLAVDNNGNALLGANLDLNGNSLLDSTGNVSINDALTMNNNKIINVAEPSNAQDAVTKNYVDTNFITGNSPLNAQLLLDNAQNVALPDLAFDGDPNTGIYSPGADQVAISTAGTGRLFIDNSGRLLVGTSTTITAPILPVAPTTQYSAGIQRHAVGSEGSCVLGNWQTGNIPAALGFVKSTSNSVGTYGTALTSGARIGAITFSGDDSAKFTLGGAIEAFADAAWGVNDAPTRLTFSTTPDGSATPVERMRITSAGLVGIGTTSPTATTHIYEADTAAAASRMLELSTASGGNFQVTVSSKASATPDWQINTGGSEPIFFSQGAAERIRIDSSGRLLAGTSTVVALSTGAAPRSPANQIANLSSSNNLRYSLSCIGYETTNGGNGAILNLGRTKAASLTNTLVSSGDVLGSVEYSGADGSGYIPAASIKGEVDGTPGANDMPGRLVFSTTPDGSATPVDRLRIDSLGRVGISGINSAAMLNARLSFEGAIVAGFRTDSVSLTSSVSEAYHYSANGATVGVGGSITNQFGYFAGSSITTATNNYGFYSAIASGTGRYGFYAAGTADSYFASNNFIFANGGSEKARIDSSGRLLAGTSAASNFIGTSQTATVQAQDTAGQIAVGIEKTGANGNPGNIYFRKTRATTNGGVTIVASNDQIGSVVFAGTDGIGSIAAARITAAVDGTPALNDMPGRLLFSTTPSGSATPLERMRITNEGNVSIGFAAAVTITRALVRGEDSTDSKFTLITQNSSGTTTFSVRNDGLFNTGTAANSPYNFTTASAANFVVAADGNCFRSTSSLKYKTNVETLQDQYADAILGCRPVWYQSTSAADNATWGYWGFIAEEVAQIDPRLVTWKTHEPVTEEDGTTTMVELPTPEAEGVQYDRFVPHLLNLIQRQQQAIETLEAKVAALENA